MNILKKTTLLGIILLFSFVMLTSATKSPMFTKNVMIARIYSHSKGYRVLYRPNNASLKQVFLPMEIFKIENGSKIFKGHNKAYPYMQIFWEEGEFSHVKLYVKEDYRDLSWGVFSNPDAYDDAFETDIKFDF